MEQKRVAWVDGDRWKKVQTKNSSIVQNNRHDKYLDEKCIRKSSSEPWASDVGQRSSQSGNAFNAETVA